MPEEALKRFADSLTEDLTGGRFLEQNLQRVDTFINKPNEVDLDLDPRVEDAIVGERPAIPGRSPEEKAAFRKEYRKSRGLHDYDLKKGDPTMVNLQKFPEMSTALGPRSRFGEGDGSFLDRWLVTPTSDPNVGPTPFNGDVIPPFTGYKRHVNTFKHGPLKATEAFRTVKPYALRRKDRLEREEKEKRGLDGTPNEFEPNGTYMHDGVVSPVASPEKTVVDKKGHSSSSNNNDDTGYLTLPPLSDAERDTYFGAKARVAFFDFYNQLARMKNITANGSTVELLGGVEMEDDESDCDDLDPGLGGVEEDEDGRMRASRKGRLPPMQQRKSAPPPPHLQKRAKKEWEESSDSDDDDAKAVLDDGVSVTTPLNEETKGTNIMAPPKDAGSFRPASARSRFIAQCVEHDIGPMPALIIRKGLSSELNLKSQHIGDDVATKLAASLEVMPHLQHFNISDNGLTDPGLSAIITALQGCSNLISLDIGRNKIDIEAASALGAYLQSTECHLNHLGLQSADIDDLEASKFVEAIAVKNTIKYLDMSRNLLGTQENKASIDPTFPTGGGSIAALLRSATCPIETLNLSWNCIRDSSIPIAKALAVNSTVTHLDLSYNSLGNEGAEVLGNSLHFNNALQKLDLTQTKICARGCYVIIQGVYSCMSLRHLILAENPIGDIGLRSVMALQMQYPSEELQVDMRGCSFKMHDSTATFDPRHMSGVYTLDLAKPYDRAVCIGLAREVALHDDICFTEYKHSNIPMKFVTRRRNKALRLSLEEQEEKKKKQQPSTLAAGAEMETGSKEGEGDAQGEEPVAASAAVEEEGKKVDILAIADDVDSAAVMFSKYDTDGSGGIDRRELMLLLRELGLDDSLTVVDSLMEQYDADGGGVIELSEFREFLLAVQLSASKNQTFENEERYLIDELHDSNPKAIEYLVPDEGMVEVTVASGQAIPEFVQAMSADKLDSLLETAHASSDSSALLQAAVSTTKLKADEAKKVYRALLKDSGDPVHSLKAILPYTFSAADARALVAYSHPASVSEICKLKQSMGRSLYNVCTGVRNGYYNLKLESESDRLCFEKLLEAGLSAKDLRSRTNQCDNSQVGDWRGFRNVLFNNMPAVIDEEFLLSIPEKGSLSFDFVQLHDFAFAKSDASISNRRFFKVLKSLHVLQKDLKDKELQEYPHFDERILKLHEEGCIGAKGVGVRYWTVEKQVCQEFTKAQDSMFEELPRRSQAQVYEDALLEVLPLEEKCLKPDEVSSSRPATALEQQQEEEVVAAADSVVGLYQSHIYRLNKSTLGRGQPVLAAYRTYEALLEALSSRYLTCAQLAYLVRLFPHGDISLAGGDLDAPRIFHGNEMAEAGGGADTTTAAASSGAAGTGTTGAAAGESGSDSAMEGGGDSDGAAAATNMAAMLLEAVKTGASTGEEAGEFDLVKIRSDKEKAGEEKETVTNAKKATSKKADAVAVAVAVAGADAAAEELGGAAAEVAAAAAAATAAWDGEQGERPFCGYDTIRVNLVVGLFSQVVDKVNLDSVLKFLKAPELAMVVFRLGYLNVFNTLKPEGYWRLDLSRRDEKQFLRALVLLSFAEPGQNWQQQSWAATPDGGEDTDWTLPLSWFNETSLPKAGVVKLKYVSSDPLNAGKEGVEEFKPDFARRAVFTCITQSQPFAADAKFVKKPTMQNAEHIITEEFGVQLTFMSPEDIEKRNK
jgi:hypothetical protein